MTAEFGIFVDAWETEGAPWMTCQSQGGHALKHHLLQLLFYYKWDHHLKK